MENNFFQELKNFFQKFPGIGPRQANRFIYSLVDFDKNDLKKMGELLVSLDKYLRRCENCFRIFSVDNKELDGAEINICNFCSNLSKRDKSKIIVVEKDSDLINFEKTKLHTGVYFVLGGLFDPLNEEIKPKTRIEILKKNTEKINGAEIVLALSSNKLSDFTCEYIKKTFLGSNVKITRLGRGLSYGIELEYADESTLKHAFFNRK